MFRIVGIADRDRRPTLAAEVAGPVAEQQDLGTGLRPVVLHSRLDAVREGVAQHVVAAPLELMRLGEDLLDRNSVGGRGVLDSLEVVGHRVDVRNAAIGRRDAVALA